MATRLAKRQIPEKTPRFTVVLAKATTFVVEASFDLLKKSQVFSGWLQPAMPNPPQVESLHRFCA
jgi:hypothetical protein